MPDVVVKIPYGQASVDFKVPSESLIGVYSPNDVKPVDSIRAEILRAINSPIGSQSLQQRVWRARGLPGW